MGMNGVRRRRGASAVDVVTPLLVAVLAAGAALVGGGYVYDAVRREHVRPAIMVGWAPARQAVANRLKQPQPLEFGAVWATHAGLYCGLVNGWGSFGGLTGMTPFAVQGRHALFPLDMTAEEFAPYWHACIADQWITIHDGSMQSGWCATRLGQERCATKSS